MDQVIANYLEKKGKQIRPIMVLLSARLLGEVNDKVLDGAVAVELLHNASLIHDDVVEADTKIQRGAATINGMWSRRLLEHLLDAAGGGRCWRPMRRWRHPALHRRTRRDLQRALQCS